MPFGPTPLAFGYFTATKAAGYSMVAAGLRSSYEKDQSWLKVGAARTLLGLAFGIPYGALFWFSGIDHVLKGNSTLVFFLGLIPIRFVEWSLLLRIFFVDRLDWSRDWKYVLIGTIASYILDAIGIWLAFVIPGGVWVC